MLPVPTTPILTRSTVHTRSELVHDTGAGLSFAVSRHARNTASVTTLPPSAIHPPRVDDELAALIVELDHDSDLDEIEVRELRVMESPLHDVRLQRCRIIGVSLAGTLFNGLELRDIIGTALDAVGARMPKATLTRVELHDCRLSGLDLAEATLRHVRFVGCRLDGVNLRMADAESIRFDDCDLRDTDFGQAKLRDVRFSGSRLVGVDFSNARCERVSLCGARVERITGTTGLRGTTIGVDQVLPLAPAVFADLGITILAEGLDPSP